MPTTSSDKGHLGDRFSSSPSRKTPSYDMDEELLSSASGLERKMYSLSPPLDQLREYSASLDERSSAQPYRYDSLLYLLAAPDMVSYLASADADVQAEALPIHLQKLISEVKEEVVLTRSRPASSSVDSPAVARLKRLQNHVWAASGNDMDSAMRTLTELLNNEDELVNIIQ